MKRIDWLRENLEHAVAKYGDDAASVQQLRRQIAGLEYREESGQGTLKAAYLGGPFGDSAGCE